jgi:AraC-like DNA-binding protein
MDKEAFLTKNISVILDIPVFFYRKNSIHCASRKLRNLEFIEYIKGMLLEETELLDEFRHLNFITVKKSGRFCFAQITRPYLLTIGPFFLSEKDRKNAISGFMEQKQNEFSEICRTLKIMSAQQLSAINSITSFMGKSDEESADVKPENRIPSNKEEAMFIFRMESDTIGQAYKAERLIRKSILNGDKKQMLKILSSLDNGVFVHKNGRVLDFKEEKLNCTTLNTICRLTAEQAGLSEIQVHAISQNYRRRINSASESEELRNVVKEMAVAYCDAVENNTLSINSYTVKTVMKHIVDNLENNHSLQELANLVHVNPSYLSRLFKKECGMTITEFIRSRKIDETKWLLQNTEIPIIEISDAFGFEYSSYFSSVFLKHVGISPSEYRKRYSHSKEELS